VEWGWLPFFRPPKTVRYLEEEVIREMPPANESNWVGLGRGVQVLVRMLYLSEENSGCILKCQPATT